MTFINDRVGLHMGSQEIRESSVSPFQEFKSLVSPNQNSVPINCLFYKVPNFPIYVNCCILTSNPDWIITLNYRPTHFGSSILMLTNKRPNTVFISYCRKSRLMNTLLTIWILRISTMHLTSCMKEDASVVCLQCMHEIICDLMIALWKCCVRWKLCYAAFRLKFKQSCVV